MTAQLKLVEIFNESQDLSNLSLFAYEDGYAIRRDGWVPGIAADDESTVIETISLAIKGDDHDDLATKIQTLDAYIRKVRDYNDNPTIGKGVYLRAQLPDETGERQALILDAQGRLGSTALGPPLSPGNFVRKYTLTLERMPFWESSEYVEYVPSGALAISLAGGKYDYTALAEGNLYGDVPARILAANLRANSVSEIDEFWAGFRGTKFGNPAAFEARWECESGTLSNSTSQTSDGTASDGSKIQCTFSDESLLKRAIVAVNDITGSYTDGLDYRGSYIVLLRAKVGTGTTCRVRMSYGLEESNNWAYRSRVGIDSTDWLLYPLGTVTFPIVPLPYNTFVASSAIRLDAERISGSNNLDMDCLVLIPYSEGAIHAVMSDPADDVQTLLIQTLSNDYTFGYSFTARTSLEISTFGNWGWSAPPGDGRLIVAGQGDSHDIDAELEWLVLNMFERWRTLRGSERSS